MDDFISPTDWPHHLPEQTIAYVIPDLHGHLTPYLDFSEYIKENVSAEPTKRHIAIYLGDYVDRGPDTKSLIDHLIQQKSSHLDNLEYVFLRGNHEKGMLGFLENPHKWANWLDYGGMETLQSYGITSEALISASRREELQHALLNALPSEHFEFLNLLDTMYVLGDYAFVHAGIQPGVPLKEQEERDLISIRQPFLSWPRPHEKCIIHGHTILSQPEIMMNRIGLDTGLYQSGTLTCAVLERNKIRLMQYTKN